MILSEEEKGIIEDEISSGKKLVSMKWLIWLYEKISSSEESIEDEHIVEFSDNGWTIMHPISCRPDLFNCPVTIAARKKLENYTPQHYGKFYCGVDKKFGIGFIWSKDRRWVL